MPENEPIRRFVPLPTQFLQEEEPSDTDEDDEQNEVYNQPLAHFQHPATRLTSAHDHRTQPFSSGRGISSNTFYGISQRNLVWFSLVMIGRCFLYFRWFLSFCFFFILVAFLYRRIFWIL